MNKYRVNDFLLHNDNILTLVEDTVHEDISIVEEYANLLSDLNCEVNIMYSGGIDSEIVAEVCKRYDIPHRLHFTAMTHNNKIYNKVDYRNAIVYSKKIEIHYLEFGKFFDSGDYINYATQYRTNSPQLACHLKVAKDIGSNVVFGGDAMSLVITRPNTEPGFLPTSIGHLCYDNLIAEIGGIANMASASYSIVIKFLRIQFQLAISGMVHETWNDQTVNFQKHNYHWKCKMYKQAGFSSVPKQDKMTGFEAIKTYYSDKYNEVGTIRKFDELYRKPLHTIIQLPDAADTKTLVTAEIKKLLKKFGEIT